MPCVRKLRAQQQSRMASLAVTGFVPRGWPALDGGAVPGPGWILPGQNRARRRERQRASRRLRVLGVPDLVAPQSVGWPSLPSQVRSPAHGGRYVHDS